MPYEAYYVETDHSDGGSITIQAAGGEKVCERYPTGDSGNAYAWRPLQGGTLYYTASKTPSVGDNVYSRPEMSIETGTITAVSPGQGLTGTRSGTSFLLGGIVSRPPLIHTPSGDSEEDWIRLNSGSRMNEGIVTITKYMHFKVPEGRNPRMYNDLDVYSHPAFPARYSRLPEDVRYYFTGNATISHGDDFHYFTAELEYTNGNLNEVTISGGTVTIDTKPWELIPDDISLSYVDSNVLFLWAYDENDVFNMGTGGLSWPTKKPYNEFGTGTGTSYVNTKIITAGISPTRIVIDPAGTSTSTETSSVGFTKVPVVNTAGDPLKLEKTVHNMKLSFTYYIKQSEGSSINTKNPWNVNNGIFFGDTINSEEITVVGITIPAMSALLLPPQADYIIQRDDEGEIAYTYWKIKIEILIDLSGTLLYRRVLNLGDRSRFAQLQFGSTASTGVVVDELISTTLGEGASDKILTKPERPEQICKVRPFKKSLNSDGSYSYSQTGDVIFMGWSQFLQYRDFAISASKALQSTDVNYNGGIVDLQCEQLSQIPLTEDGYVDVDYMREGGSGLSADAFKAHMQKFLQYRVANWSTLDMPTVGIGVVSD